MRAWVRAAAVVGGLALAAVGPSRAADPVAFRLPLLFPPQLRVADSAAYHSAFAAAAIGAWDEALALAAAAKAPLPGKVVRWLYYTDAGTSASFAEISAFLDGNPDWPDTGVLARNAEAALADEEEALGPAIIIDWFARHSPRSGPGKAAYATALTASARGAEAAAWAARAWTEESLSLEVEARLLTEFGATFTAADHLARTDMLIWRGLTGEATRMVHRVPEDERPLAKARIALRAEANGVDAAIARVPAWQQADPRLVFERVRWRRRHNLTETAIELLRTNPDQTGPATAWWDERSILARRSMGDGAWANAYELVHAHGQTRRGAVAEAEWLAGWIALRHLDDVEAAYIHFARGQAVVTTPVSLARAEYWSARAAEALEALEVAQSRYEEAAQYPTTFYGQLAMEALAEGPMLALPADPQPNIVEADRLAEHELTLVCILLAELEQQDYMRPFLLALADDPTSPGEWQLFARLAAALGRLDVSVSLSKLALRGDLVMPEAGWPAPPSLSPDGAVERALVLAIIRQESEFDDSAISPAGARGLMQLMPATARQVAGSIRVVYDPDRLAHDRGYNVQLGTAHLGNLLETFGGSYVLSVAAYNAGGARVRTWIGEYGDPRNADVDPVDWIESIPFAETRNYVQRVMENLQVYRARLAGGKANVTLGETLGR